MEGDSPPSPPPSSEDSNRALHGGWTMWAHLPHDTDWSVESYKKIFTFHTVDSAVSLMSALPDPMVRNCMLFMMREGIHPTWEDERNRDGGCFSYKVGNKNVSSVWRQLAYKVAGESLSSHAVVRAEVNGGTISPKKNFCIIKIWMASCKHQDPKAIDEIDGLTRAGCIFKRHVASG